MNVRNYLFEAIKELGYKNKLIRCGTTIDSIVWKDETDVPTKEEIQAKIKELEAEEVKNQIANIATNKVKEILKEYDYDSEGEVALYAANENSEWYEEAKAIQTWIEEVYKKMYELQDTVTIDNYETIDLEAIETELPEFTQ